MVNGYCECPDDSKDIEGKCLCPFGKLFVDKNCKQCGAFCASCSNSLSECDSYSWLFYLLIVLAVILFILSSILIYFKFIKKRTVASQISETLILT